MTESISEIRKRAWKTRREMYGHNGRSSVARMAKPCSVPDCGKPKFCKGYCRAHYLRFARHGDPLSGRTSRGDILRFINEVVLLHVGEECLLWPYSKSTGGYGQACIDGRTATASRYVCEVVNGAPPAPEHQAAHSCGKGHLGCVNPRHLRWATPKENAADKVIHGNHHRGRLSETIGRGE